MIPTPQGVDAADQANLDLLGDLSTIVGPGVEGPPTLTAGFAAIAGDLAGKLSRNRVYIGSVTIASGATTGTTALAVSEASAVFTTWKTGWGLASRSKGAVAAGTLTITVDMAPGVEIEVWYLIFDLT